MITRKHIGDVVRRRMPRLEMRLEAGVAVVARLVGRVAGVPQFQCATKDVSVEGMRLVSDTPIPEGRAVRLWVTLPNDEGGKTLELNGWVRWALNEATTGRFLAGVHLAGSPRSSVAAWAGAIGERIREHFSNPVNQPSPVVL